jgi:hypothetical protein
MKLCRCSSFAPLGRGVRVHAGGGLMQMAKVCAGRLPAERWPRNSSTKAAGVLKVDPVRLASRSMLQGRTGWEGNDGACVDEACLTHRPARHRLQALKRLLFAVSQLSEHDAAMLWLALVQGDGDFSKRISYSHIAVPSGRAPLSVEAWRWRGFALRTGNSTEEARQSPGDCCQELAPS